MQRRHFHTPALFFSKSEISVNKGVNLNEQEEKTVPLMQDDYHRDTHAFPQRSSLFLSHHFPSTPFHSPVLFPPLFPRIPPSTTSGKGEGDGDFSDCFHPPPISVRGPILLPPFQTFSHCFRLLRFLFSERHSSLTRAFELVRREVLCRPDSSIGLPTPLPAHKTHHRNQPVLRGQLPRDGAVLRDNGHTGQNAPPRGQKGKRCARQLLLDRLGTHIHGLCVALHFLNHMNLERRRVRSPPLSDLPPHLLRTFLQSLCGSFAELKLLLFQFLDVVDPPPSPAQRHVCGGVQTSTHGSESRVELCALERGERLHLSLKRVSVRKGLLGRLACDCNDASDSLLDALLRENREFSNLTAVLDMRPPTKLHRLPTPPLRIGTVEQGVNGCPDSNQTDRVGVLFSKHRTEPCDLPGLAQGHFSRVNLQLVPHGGTHDPLDGLDLVHVHGFAPGEVKTETGGLHEGPFLVAILPENLSQREVQEMCACVVLRNRSPSVEVDGQHDVVTLREGPLPCGKSAYMEEIGPKFLAVFHMKHPPSFLVNLHAPCVEDLPTHFGIVIGPVEDQTDALTGLGHFNKVLSCVDREDLCF
mmetsp:Transcript_48034/g.94875  ORF Transcript_48034/g.94875 Transcript_48034/m.94875 type:complete len:585 (-) Transcript_48034:1660-3414(-)